MRAINVPRAGPAGKRAGGGSEGGLAPSRGVPERSDQHALLFVMQRIVEAIARLLHQVATCMGMSRRREWTPHARLAGELRLRSLELHHEGVWGLVPVRQPPTAGSLDLAARVRGDVDPEGQDQRR